MLKKKCEKELKTVVHTVVFLILIQNMVFVLLMTNGLSCVMREKINVFFITSFRYTTHTVVFFLAHCSACCCRESIPLPSALYALLCQKRR